MIFRRASFYLLFKIEFFPRKPVLKNKIFSDGYGGYSGGYGDAGYSAPAPRGGRGGKGKSHSPWMIVYIVNHLIVVKPF